MNKMKLLSFLVIGLAIAGNISAAKKSNIKYRGAVFTDSWQLNNVCPLKCNKHNETWTQRFRTNTLGIKQCECKIKEKKSWWNGRSGEKKPADIKYRSIGFGKTSENIANECPVKCVKNKEKYTGNWRDNWLTGTQCECRGEKPSKK